MRVRIFFITLLVFSKAQALSQEKPHSTVCLNMIVKNEREVITRCLQSTLPFIDTWVIVDTGSTDGTQEIIKAFLKDIPGTLYERPWVNFGHNRNEALALAKDKADYVLFMDADDELLFSKDFKLPELTADFYYMPAGGNGCEFVLPRFVKTSVDWQWRGAIHEHILASHETSGILLNGIEYHYVNDGARSRDPETYRKDVKLLKEAIELEPERPRNYYYLAMSYIRLGELDLALATHEKRANMPGWAEEAFISKLYIAILQSSLKKDVKIVRQSFLDAYLFYPQRVEPLFYLIETFQQEGDYEKAFEVAKCSLELSLEKNGSLLVEKWMYDFGLLMKYAVCAAFTGRFSESLDACQKVLAREDLPENYRQEMQECYEKVTAIKNSQTKEALAKLVRAL